MERIMVFGATGGTGKQVVEQALQAGHHVTAVVRNPDTFPFRHKELEIIKGDVFRPETFEEMMENQNAVISCLGIQKREPTTVYSEGVGNILEVMRKENVHRIICISASAVIVPPKSSFMLKFVTSNILQRLFKHSYSDMLVMEKLLRESHANWTIIRAPWLRDTKLTGRYRVAINAHLKSPSKISRADLAHCILNLLMDENASNSTIEISY